VTHPADPRYWVDLFGRAELPVLGNTVSELERMRQDPDRVSTAQLSDIVMRDPLMTSKVLRYIQQHRHRTQLVDVTTVAHALMMLGLEPFLAHFSKEPTVQAHLEHDATALQGVLRVASRARHAALYAREWAVLRHDIEVEEVTTAALLHDLAELMLWCCAPGVATLLDEATRADDAARDAAQRAVLGFTMISLQVELAEQWQLPDLLCRLMDERHASTPRALNVSLAVSVARHTSSSWDEPALVDDFVSVGRLLGCGAVAARERVLRVALRAAAEWTWYGVPPAAALLPVSTGVVPRARVDARRAGAR
jgi:HD-like signal output (HDOD) protein